MYRLKISFPILDIKILLCKLHLGCQNMPMKTIINLKKTLCMFILNVIMFARTLIEKANQWLKENPERMLWKCETVIMKLKSEDEVDTESVYYMESAYGTNVFLMVLR